MPKIPEGLLQWGARTSIHTVCLALLAAVPWISGAHQVSSQSRNDWQPIAQPLPFSHRSHSQLGLNCSSCHTMEGRGGSAGFPSVALCLSCHRGGKGESTPVGVLLEGYEQKGETIPWGPGLQDPRFRLLQPQGAPGLRSHLHDLPRGGGATGQAQARGPDFNGALHGLPQVPGSLPGMPLLSRVEPVRTAVDNPRVSRQSIICIDSWHKQN